MSAGLGADSDGTGAHGVPIGFVLHPGWGFPAGALAPWAEALARRWPAAPVQFRERCYFGATPQPPLVPGVRWVGIGHSFGHALLRQTDEPWFALVALHGFTRFCRRPGRPQGTPPRLLDAMRARLRSQPQEVLRDFHRLCGAAERQPPPELALQPLDDDLLALRELDLGPAEPPLLVLASRDDAVVPAALTEACFADAGEIVWRGGDHCAWLRAADEGVGQLSHWLARLPAAAPSDRSPS